MSRVFINFKALLASPASASSAAAAHFSSSASIATASKSATSKAAQKTPKKSTTSKRKAEKPATPRTRTRPSGIFKIAPVSPALGQFVEAQQAYRTDAVKQIWNYIKAHNLQVLSISCLRNDEQCCIWCLISLSFKMSTSEAAFSPSAFFILFNVCLRVSIVTCTEIYGNFCLQNPDNKREIFCDEKLKTIFDGKEKVGFLEIGKMLSRHFVKSS
ncbi:uncharacterized protein LOC120208238 [Hibiscus syriacus]|uniref:uncharacterized protein LOC120208238 n=1 Tax=Hibiscus syriacus TaxID=106335 RepID=UPI001923F10E|nr:uncharacterized protein LOC120208238 [Hibiscus syriacus]